MALVLSVLEQGLIYAVMALGVYITYKILDFPDLTVDGSFPFGAAVTVVLLDKGCPPLLTLLLTFLAGGIIGIVTGLIHVKLKVRDLLSGIIMMTALYTVNLRITGRANYPIYTKETIFNNALLTGLVPESVQPYQTVLICLIIVIAVKLLLDLYLKTKSGFLLRAVGDNPSLLTTLAVDKGFVKIVGLAIANGLVALSGCIFAQQQRFFDISVGTGTVVIGLASVIIGTSLCKLGKKPWIKVTTSVVLGSILYKGCVGLAVSFGFAASDMKLITAILFLLILVVTMDRKRGAKADA